MSSDRKARIVIAAGGTAGHVVPALAVAAELRSRGAEVIFIGGERAEADLVPAAGFPLHRIAVEGLSRRDPLRAARALGKASAALAVALRELRRLRADAVLGGGGYVSGPVGLAALIGRVPLVLTEADSHLGLANRLLARGARRVCLALPLSGREGGRYRVTGRPVPPVKAGRSSARAELGLAPGDRCVVVFGGSLGARSINLAALEGLADLDRSGDRAPLEGLADLDRSGDRAPLEGPADLDRSGDRVPVVGDDELDGGIRVVHICGRRDHSRLSGRALPEEYQLIDYLDTDGFDRVLAAADLVIARAGGSVFEIASHGVPAILVPYPHAAADHQSANARWMANAGAAVVIEDGQLTGQRLREEVRALLADRGRLAAMASASSALARPDAAAEVAEELLAAAGKRGER